MSTPHPPPSTDTPHVSSEPRRAFGAGSPADAHKAVPSVGSASLESWDRGDGAAGRSGRDQAGGGALTPTTFSGFSTPTTTSFMMDAEVEGDKDNANNIQQPTVTLPNSEANAVLPQPQPQRRVRQWTPRRRSPGSCSIGSTGGGTVGDSGVTTVRDWVQSTRCSPSKEPRSSSASRRDGFVSSFVSALVPREAHPSSNGGDERSGAVWSRSATTTTASARSGSQVGSARGDSENEQQQHQHRVQSPPRTASWRQLRSHPGGASSRVPPPLPSPAAALSSFSSAQSSLLGTPTFSSALSRCDSWFSANALENWEGRGVQANESADATDLNSMATSATLMRGWGTSDPSGQRAASVFSGVSSPSVLTPLSSRAASPTVFASHLRNDKGTRYLHLPTSSSSSVLSVGISARELEQMREWQGTTEAQQQGSITHDNSSGAGALYGQAANLPPAVPRAAQRGGLSERRRGGIEPLSARSDSLSRASASSYSNTIWGDQRNNDVPTSLGWWSYGSDDSGRGPPLSSTASSHRLSPVSFSHAWSGGGGRELPGSCTATPLPPPSPHVFPSDVLAFGCGRQLDADGAVDERTMEDIEDEDRKRKCVESPTTSPMLAALSLSLGSSSPSLAEALSAQPSRLALPSEVHLWQQRARRRRGVSPSVARPDEDDEGVGLNDAMGGVTDGSSGVVQGDCNHAGRGYEAGPFQVGQRDAEAAALGGGGGSSSSNPPRSPPTSAARTAASSAAPACTSTTATRPPPLTGHNRFSHHRRGQRQGSDHDGLSYDADSSPPLAPLREATVAPSAAARVDVTEVGGAEEDGDREINCRAASLSFCSASEDEPEVDTFTLERSQAVMEDADAEAFSALLARQHHLRVHATSDFASDLRAHGVHVDPALWEEEEALEGGGSCMKKELLTRSHRPVAAGTEGVAEGVGTGPSYACGSFGAQRASTAITSTTTCSPRSPPPVPPTAANAAASPFEDPKARCTSSTTTAAPSTPPTSRISGEEHRLYTPLRPKCPAHHVRLGETEDSEEMPTPGSATTMSSRSRRDVSPPVRERSMAPAEL
ncbi:hypothetical protein ABL78_4534 [Leptomonas seymouri]|uniref:Uncharacterized protein n=1 Tax=Leptomonas seymouri TaxID=5684 RepID=A0A0N1HY38_LEPSE|nr:hypothetical protein ABL78_4534 [Leptomonas seymouri]|eukprot:KPI86418.1 hypothetical protein ABL78_4534 [Leptomonas seymouri]